MQMTKEEDISRRFQDVSKRILNASRNELYSDQHYLALALGSLSFAVTTDIQGIGTDGVYLAAHPKHLADLFEKDRRLVNRIFLHEVYHCLFRHIFRKIPADRELWMLSCDMAVEFLIDSQNLRTTRMPRNRFRENTRHELLEHARVLNAESIYRELVRSGLGRRYTPCHDAQPGAGSDRRYAAGGQGAASSKITSKAGEDAREQARHFLRLRQEFSADDHSLWPSLEADGKQQKIPPKSIILQKKWEDISSKTQTQMESFSVEQSSGAGDLLEETRVENRERFEYRSFLRKFAAIREEMHIDNDSWDSILYTLGLEMYGNMPLIEPVETREVKKIDEFAIVIDTSMSVSGRLVHSFLEQTYSILSESESYLHKVNIRIIQCDEQVQSDRLITSRGDLEDYMAHFKLAGGGGTDFRPAFEYVENLIRDNQFQDLRGLLYFTDGKGIYPSARPPFETAFIFCEESYDDSAVPPWAIRLVLPREDVETDEKELSDARFVWEEDRK